METSHDQSGLVLDGRYRLVAPLAEGAMGSVYRAERLGLGREVAVKMMHAALPGELSARERFEREAQVMAKLTHPHCVSVIDFGVHADKPYLVMELVRGESLFELIARERPLPLRRAAEIARQILAGIAHAHAQEIVHRDIKPANIMISTKEALGDHVQILDFGLARLCESSSLLTSGITVGTPSYMAPEQCRGGPLDARVDVYAVGVVLFEMLAGRKPFIAPDPLAIVKKQLLEKPPRLSDVAPDAAVLDDIVARALAKDPKERFASAIEMATAIEIAVPGTRATTSTPVVGVPAMTGPQPAILNAPPIPLLGSSALVPIDESSTAPVAEPSIAPVSQPVRLDPHEASMLRRMLPASRMKWAALFLLLFVIGSIYGIIRVKQYLAEQAAQESATR